MTQIIIMFHTNNYHVSLDLLFNHHVGYDSNNYHVSN